MPTTNAKDSMGGIAGACHCGRVTWSLDALPDSITACNCTICRRYGVLWAYGYANHSIHIDGETTAYLRDDDGALAFQFCSTCGCVTHYVATRADSQGRYLTAVNTRMADPEKIGHLPVRHFEGLVTFTDLPQDQRCVADMWF